MGLQVFMESRDLRGQIRTYQEDRMKSSGAVYEVECKNCIKKYTGETGRKLKERITEHKNDGEKARKEEKITGLSQHMKTIGHSPDQDNVRIIYRENNWKKRGNSKKQPE